jgi:hypothetical protein
LEGTRYRVNSYSIYVFGNNLLTFRYGSANRRTFRSSTSTTLFTANAIFTGTTAMTNFDLFAATGTAWNALFAAAGTAWNALFAATGTAWNALFAATGTAWTDA